MIPNNTLNTNGLPVFVWADPAYTWGQETDLEAADTTWSPGTTSPGVAKLILMALLGGF